MRKTVIGSILAAAFLIGTASSAFERNLKESNVGEDAPSLSIERELAESSEIGGSDDIGIDKFNPCPDDDDDDCVAEPKERLTSGIGFPDSDDELPDSDDE